MRVGSTRITKAIKKQTMGTYAFNIYGWLIGMPTVPQPQSNVPQYNHRLRAFI
jgi:hypothetical protein